MSTTDTKFADTIIDAQKKVVESVTENAKKMANGNNFINETIDKSSEWYKNWLEGQKNFFKKTTETGANATESVKENASKMNEFFQNWMTMQNNWTKQMADMNKEWMKGVNQPNTNTNPFSNWQNNWSNWMNQMNTNNWMNQMQQHNPFTTDALKNGTENWTNFANQYQNILKNTFTNWQNHMENGTAQDAYKNFTFATDAFNKFAELWMPMYKSMQDKTFNMDVYKQWMNPEMYKELMDKYFGFIPENSRHYMQQMTDMMQNGAKQMNETAMQNYNQMRANMSQAGFNPANMFGNMLSGYNNLHGMMSEAAAPFTKMMTQTDQTKAMQEWADISNRINVYNIKNAELQYMIYAQGSKVMDKLAENISAKIKDGKTVNNLMEVYQEWLNLGDKVFVNLFESDEYSKLMAEVSAMQMQLKKDMERQMEKQMTAIPVATRSEMDEVYKTIYELKTQIRQLEKMIGLEEEAKEAVTEEKPVKRTAKKA